MADSGYVVKAEVHRIRDVRERGAEEGSRAFGLTPWEDGTVIN